MTPEPQVLSVLTLEQPLRASAALEPLVLAFVTPEPQVVLAYKPLEPLPPPFKNREPLVLAVLPLGQLLPASVALDPLVLPFRNREPLVLALVLLGQLLLGSTPLEPLPLEPLLLACVNLKNLLVVRKNRSSSSPAGASSQIAPSGRSGIILTEKAKFPRFEP